MSRYTDSKYVRWSSDYYYSNEDPALPFSRKDTGVKVAAFDMLKAAFDMGVNAAREELRASVLDMFLQIGLELDSDD